MQRAATTRTSAGATAQHERLVRRGAAGWTVVSALLVLLTALTGAARATVPPSTDGATDSLTWSIRPTPTQAEPDRPNFSFGLKEGDSVSDSIRIRNFGTRKLALKIYASDALTTASGALDLLPASAKPKDVGAWTTLNRSSIEVEPTEYVDVPFTVRVPGAVESGDHTGGIVTSISTDGAAADGQPVILDRRLGSRIQVRVAGPLRPALEISNLRTRYSTTANPVGSGTINVTYTVKNTGNVRLAADQIVQVKGPARTRCQGLEAGPNARIAARAGCHPH